MKRSVSIAFTFAGIVLARNDWSQPCFHGECNFDVEHPTGGRATLQFLGAPHAIADITPAAGWVILDCDPHALEQDIRLVCANDDTDADHCAHLFSNGGPEGKILRLPESCGRGPFVRIANAYVDADQSIPIHATRQIRRRDGVAPEVHVLSVDTAWDKFAAGSRHGDTEYTIVGASIPGVDSISDNAIAERGFSDWVTKTIAKLKKLAGKVVDGAIDATTIEQGNGTEITTSYSKDHDIIDLSAECAGKKAALKLNTYVNVKLEGHVGFAAKGSLKDGIKEFGSLAGWHGTLKGGFKITAEVAGPMQHQQILVRYGVPPFDWPGVISIGPRFEVVAHVNGSLDITGTADIGLTYNIKKVEHVWPAIKDKNEGQEADIEAEDPRVNMEAVGDVDAKLNVTLGFFPAVVIGLEGFAGQVRAAISGEVEPFIRLEGAGKLEAGVDHQIKHPSSAKSASRPSSPSKSRPGSPKSPRPASPKKKTRRGLANTAEVAEYDNTDDPDVKFKAGASGSFKIVGGVEVRGVAVGKLYKFLNGRLSKTFWRKEWKIVDTGEGAVGSLKSREIDASRPSSPRKSSLTKQNSTSSTKSSLSKQNSTTSIKSTSSSKSLKKQGSTTSTKSQPADDVEANDGEEEAKKSWRNTQWKCPPAVEKAYEMIFVGKGTKPKWEFGHIYEDNVASTATVPPPSTQKKYKATLSAESRVRTTKPPVPPILGSTSKSLSSSSSSSLNTPRTPTTPRSRSRGPQEDDHAFSEMDMSRVDPEEVLVDYQTVENDPADGSVEIDEEWLRASLGSVSHGKEDKVMVSVRMRTSEASSAWVADQHSNTIKLDPACAKHGTSAATSTTFTFDAIHTETPNKPIYSASARSHVHAAMDGYNAVIFAYGQTASGKTFTLSGTKEEPGIIPRAMRDIFGYIKRTPAREYLLRCSYLEIYNETIVDLLAPPSTSGANVVQLQGTGPTLHLAPLREEVVTSFKAVKEVLQRGEGNRRTACTDWNERSSRSHSVFRVVIESRERDETSGRQTPGPSGRQTPGLGGRQTPGLGGRQTPGPKLQARGGRSVQCSVLSLIDLAGSEKATSDKERTKEGKYINTSLLTLGTVIGTLSENAAKGKSDHVPFRNSKLTRLLQPSLSGNARISVICTVNPDARAVAESTSTLLFAKRVKGVQLHAQKKEIVDTDALIERYQKEIEDLKKRLADREAEAPVRNRRLSAREQIDESKAMRDLNSRIQQLTKLILTSQNVDEGPGDASRPASPVKVDFDMSPYQLQQELLNARHQLESQASQILSLEAALLDRSPLSSSASESEKDKLIAEQTKTIRELEIVVKGYEDNLGEPLRQVKEDVEKEWSEKLKQERRIREEGERWAEELVKQLDKEKKMRTKLEEERRALAAFVSKFDALGLGGFVNLPAAPSRMKQPTPVTPALSERKNNRIFVPPPSLPAMQEEEEMAQVEAQLAQDGDLDISPLRSDPYKGQPSLLEQNFPEEDDWNILNEVSFEIEASDMGSKILGGKTDSRVKALSARFGKENTPC
ncbi:hypothetical protein ONZ45_g312 [Pleurotus djamor]|nr:hypothetical protein ONZ45_g312 [Pleurotus djamor]